MLLRRLLAQRPAAPGLRPLLARALSGTPRTPHIPPAAESSRRHEPLSSPPRHPLAMPLADAVVDVDGLRVAWEDSSSTVYHLGWLRHNCKCSECVEPSSGQRTAFGARLNHATAVAALDAASPDTLDVTWADGHSSTFAVPWLRQYQPSDNPHALPQPFVHEGTPAPMPETISENRLPCISYGEVMADTAGLHRWLTQLGTYGASLVFDAPPQDETVVRQLASLISHPQATIYGEDFVVEVQEQPINVAYTSLPLDLHQDLIYYESAPGLQLLHCVEFGAGIVGGESTLMDGFAVAEQLRSEDPAAFATLARIPASFQKIHYQRQLPVHMSYSRPHISLNRRGEVIGVSWAPPFQGPLRASLEDTQAYYEALPKLAALIEDQASPLRNEFRLRPGDVLTFNNRRMLHGRNGFIHPAGNHRRLVGTYVNIDEFKSRLFSLSMQLGVAPPGGHVGNLDLV